MTKIGKTTLGHSLSGVPLKGDRIHGQIVAIPASSKNQQAKVGNSMHSETEIPNHFPVRLQGRP
jgi:hypothetical protein